LLIDPWKLQPITDDAKVGDNAPSDK